MFYLDHEERVKFVDGVLAHSQEWQWLIDIISEKAEFKDIDSWGDFVNERIQLQTIYEYFVKILSFCDREWEWPQVQIQQLWLIAQFYLDMISMEECVQDITDISCTLFLFCVWITKLENVDNETDYLLDIRLLCQRNCYEIIKCNSLQMSEDDLMNYANEYFGDHLEVPIDCLCDNIEHKKYLCDINFLQQYETAIMNYNCFGYRSLTISDCTTWQEEGLLDLLKISIRDRQVVPMFSGNGRSVPDVDSWTEGSLLSIKDFFRNDMSDFLVETVLYVLLQIEPSQKVKLTHCKLLTQALEAGEDSFKIANSSSYAILSYLHADYMMKDCNDSQEYITLIKLLQEEKDPEIILQYSESGYPLKREQKGIVKDFLENKYKAIDDIDDIYRLNSYMEDEYTTKSITTEYLRKVDEKFNSLVAKKNDILEATVFYQYMLFLFNVNKNSGNVNKRYVQSMMIKLQQLWQNSAYEKQRENLHVFSHETTIKTAVIERFSEQSLMNPIVFARNCIPCTEEKVLDIMIHTSEHPMLFLVSRISLTSVFPEKGDGVRYERHDIDKMLLEYVDKIRAKKGYKLLNVLESEKYVWSIHEKYRECTQAAVSMFIKEKELYQMVRKETKEIRLGNYCKNITLGHLTQLFPVLEIRIRELVKLFGIFPFKKNKDEFMQYNDPSSLLRELLKQIYVEQQGFDNVPDLLYVYNIMYNSNSYNIRNECVHGRDYLEGNSLHFAFRATLMAIAMVNFRIKTIQDNVSDIC